MARTSNKLAKVLLSAFIGINIFYPLNLSGASADGVVINEVMIGQTGAAKNEFIELYNNANADIDLSGWSLKKKTQSGSESNLVSAAGFSGIIPAHGFFLIAHPDYREVISADIAYSGISYSVASDNTLLLYDAAGALVDKLGYGEAADKENNPALNPPENKSLVRDPAGRDTDDNGADFALNDTPTPANRLTGADENSDPETDPVADIPDANTDDQTTEDTGAAPENPETPAETEEGADYHLGQILINEFVSDPADNAVEFVELYNPGRAPADLTGWMLEDGSGAKTVLSGHIGASGDDRFFILEKPKGNLNNAGDIIILRSPDGTLIDRVSYGNWDDNDLSDNAPTAPDPLSVARKTDGHNTFNNSYDFAITESVTPGAKNLIIASPEAEEEFSAEDLARYDYSDNIFISEIYPNPPGPDDPEEYSSGEFIELYNSAEKTVDLTGWKLRDEGRGAYEFKIINSECAGNKNCLIAPKTYLVVYRRFSKIALNNTADSVKLYQPLKDEPLISIKYEKATEAWSYANKKMAADNESAGAKNWVWTEIRTPGALNEIKTVNHPPRVDFDCPDSAPAASPIFFDSSDTFDEDGDTLNYAWNFGDNFTNTLAGPEHTFFIPGNFTVSLTVSDGVNEVKKEKIIKIISADGGRINPRGDSEEPPDIIINELLPDPEGRDEEEEFIELYNRGHAEINLINWKLDDGEGGGQPHIFTDEFQLTGGSYLVVSRADSGLALNNTADFVRLWNAGDKLIDEAEYGQTAAGEAYARGENEKWFWTTAPTPGEKNIIKLSDSAALKTAGSRSGGNAKTDKQEKIIIETTPSLAKNFEVGDVLKIKGLVAVVPGILGTQYFYISDKDGRGIQVYNYKKDFPRLSVGDPIAVSGELSQTNGEWRLKTKEAADMEKLEGQEMPEAKTISCAELDETFSGDLIAVTGEIVEKKGSSLFLDDGTDEIKIYLSQYAGINSQNIAEGDLMSVSGLVNSTKSGLRLMPRGPEDIIKKDAETPAESGAGQVLGEVAASDEWAIAARDKKLELFRYLLIIAGAAIAVLAGLLIKLKIK